MGDRELIAGFTDAMNNFKDVDDIPTGALIEALFARGYVAFKPAADEYGNCSRKCPGVKMLSDSRSACRLKLHDGFDPDPEKCPAGRGCENCRSKETPIGIGKTFPVCRQKLCEPPSDVVCGSWEPMPLTEDLVSEVLSRPDGLEKIYKRFAEWARTANPGVCCNCGQTLDPSGCENCG